jgi:hypothetical protein
LVIDKHQRTRHERTPSSFTNHPSPITNPGYL